MALACAGGLLFIFVLPLFGLPKSWSTVTAIAVMFGLHLWMMRGHSGSEHHNRTARRK